ncbi:MAG: hypothetical protein QW292_12475 [Candidatus Parvarchaeota archaeon]
MKISKKYRGIFEQTRKIGIPDKETALLIEVWKTEFLGEPRSLGDLLEVVE